MNTILLRVIHNLHSIILQILEEFNLVGKKEHPFGQEISGIVINGIINSVILNANY